MGVRITYENTVALYESTTEVAFGPVFDMREEAEEFLDWLSKEAAKGREFEYGNDKLLVLENAAIYRNDELVFLKDMWEKERR